MNIALWITQIVLAITFAIAGIIKVSRPKEDVVKKLGEWANDFSRLQIKAIGTVELLGSVGLILPQLTGVLPVLTPIAAIGLIFTMIGATLVHLRRKEFSDILFNIILFALAAFVAYGRFSFATPPSTPTLGIKCMESADYFVVDNNPGLPGLDVVAKHKTSASQVIPCTDAISTGDIAIKNNLPEDVLGVVKNFLIVDSGTAPPPRGIKIYDLDTQTSIFMDTYSPPLSISSATITYWESTSQPVTQKNCPDLNQYIADGLGAVIESHIILDLPALTKKELGEYRCAPTQ